MLTVRPAAWMTATKIFIRLASSLLKAMNV
jgi:hypothetical protein